MFSNNQLINYAGQVAGRNNKINTLTIDLLPHVLTA
jgi:hypothetical protein